MPPGSSSESTPFSRLGLTPSFDLEPGAVERAFLRRIALVHPDHAGDAEPEGADPVATLTADRDVLLDPERRAGLLLSLLGGPAASQDHALPDGFLFEIMEIRQAMEEELAAEPAAARAKWQAWAMERRKEHVETLKPLFTRAAAGESNLLGEIRRTLNAWRYVERMIEQLDPQYHPSREVR
jgi:hypothetical protein